jgi:hypothetical protein
MRMKEHLAEAYQSATAFHKSMKQQHDGLSKKHEHAEKSHMALSKCFTTMGKASSGDDGFQNIAEHHAALAGDHGTMSEHHASLAKFHGDAADKASGFASDCTKANETDLAKVVPDNISSTIPSDVPFGIRSVSRHGQPDLAFDKASVPAQFQHLVELNDEV